MLLGLLLLQSWSVPLLPLPLLQEQTQQQGELRQQLLQLPCQLHVHCLSHAVAALAVTPALHWLLLPGLLLLLLLEEAAALLSQQPLLKAPLSLLLLPRCCQR